MWKRIQDQKRSKALQAVRKNKMIFAIDPGNKDSAYVIIDGGRLVEFGKIDNFKMLGIIFKYKKTENCILAIEMIENYGFVVGADVFQTCLWIGRFIQAWNQKSDLVYRREVKMEFLGKTRGKDKDIRAALIDLYGPGQHRAVGTKQSPGPLYGFADDTWSALAVALYYKRKVDGSLEIQRQQVLKIQP